MSTTLRAALAAERPLVAPGVFDALTALLAEQAGFACAYLSGASIAYTRLARPDVGLTTLTEVADTLARIAERVAIPVIVDADTGYGNAVNVVRTVRLLERCGAGGIQLEDQTFPKRCGHLRDKGVVPAAEMVGKVKAAVDARADAETLIVARTDAVAVEGFDAAVERAHAYREAGADILFVEAPRTDADLAAVAERLGDAAPLLANMVEGGDTPLKPAAELGELGFRIVIFPGGLARLLTRTAQDYFATLRRHGTTAPLRERMLDFAGLNEVIGLQETLALGRRYEGER